MALKSFSHKPNIRSTTREVFFLISWKFKNCVLISWKFSDHSLLGLSMNNLIDNHTLMSTENHNLGWAHQVLGPDINVILTQFEKKWECIIATSFLFPCRWFGLYKNLLTLMLTAVQIGLPLCSSLPSYLNTWTWISLSLNEVGLVLAVYSNWPTSCWIPGLLCDLQAAGICTAFQSMSDFWPILQKGQGQGRMARLGVPIPPQSKM